MTRTDSWAMASLGRVFFSPTWSTIGPFGDHLAVATGCKTRSACRWSLDRMRDYSSIPRDPQTIECYHILPIARRVAHHADPSNHQNANWVFSVAAAVFTSRWDILTCHQSTARNALLLVRTFRMLSLLLYLDIFRKLDVGRWILLELFPSICHSGSLTRMETPQTYPTSPWIRGLKPHKQVILTIGIIRWHSP